MIRRERSTRTTIDFNHCTTTRQDLWGDTSHSTGRTRIARGQVTSRHDPAQTHNCVTCHGITLNLLEKEQQDLDLRDEK